MVEYEIKPAARLSLGGAELWKYRELFYYYTWRDIKVRYKQTALGVLWALLQPLGMMALFVLIFSRSSIAQSPGMPYPVFVLSGLVVWNLFYHAVSHAAEGMISNAAIIKKIYFPRLVIPLSAMISALIDFIIGLVLLLVCCMIYGQSVQWTALLFFPLAIGLVLVAAFGLGTWLGALNVKFRDFRYALPFLLQFLFFGTQVFYPSTLAEEKGLQLVFALNPVNAAIELFRYPLGLPVNVTIITMGTAMALVLLLTGIFYFKKSHADTSHTSSAGSGVRKSEGRK